MTTIQEVLADPAGAPLPADRAEFDRLADELAAELDAANVDAFFVYVARLSPEWQVRAMVRAIRREAGRMAVTKEPMTMRFVRWSMKPEIKDLIASDEGRRIIKEEYERATT